MIYSLAGVAHLGSDVGGSAFLIPFFQCRNSNRHFAQDLDGERRIIAFKEFDPFRYQISLNGLPPFERSVGDMGVMAIRQDGAILVEEALQIINHVRKLRLRSQNAPFFEIDACVLAGRSAGLVGAVRRAAKALGDGGLARSWERAELRVLRRTNHRTDLEELEDAIRELVGSMEDPKWVRRWLAIWYRHQGSDAVVDVGLQYVVSPIPRVEPKGRVLAQLLKSRQRLRMPAVIGATQAWLSAAIRLIPADPVIGRAWLALTSIGAPLQDDMLEWGLKFVEASAWSETPAMQWPDVWASLWHVAGLARPADRKLLLHLARAALWDKRESPRCTRLAVKALKSAISDEEAKMVLLNWVCEIRSHTNAWVEAFLAVATEPLSNELVDAATLWLATEPGQLRRWADVFETIISARPTDTEVLSIGNDWLKRANPQLSKWPKVARFVFPQSADAEVEKQVKAWIAAHPENPAAWDLSLMITDLEERREVHARI